MNQFFESNQNLLLRKNPELCRKLNDCPCIGAVHVIPTLSRYPTLLFSSENGSPKFLHSPHNPVEEARDMISEYQFFGEDLTILFGFGLGYLPLSIAAKMHPEHGLFVIESSLEILKAALSFADLSDLLNHERVRVFHTDQTDRIWEALEKEQFRILGGRVGKLIHPPSYGMNPGAYDRIEERIERYVAIIKDNFKTLEGHGQVTLKNIIQNIFSYTESAPVDPLADMAMKRPALVVTSGPSLDLNIDCIKGMENKLLIIATDSAFTCLIKQSILPHVVVSVDPINVNMRKFDQLTPDLLKKTSLVYSPYVFPDIPALFSGPKFVFNEHNLLCQWALPLWYPAKTLPYGFSVSHYAFYLARLMGADPIIFVGLDLSFPGKKGHAQNSGSIWSRGFKFENLPVVPGLKGEMVPTMNGFINMITLFEKEIAKTDAVCIDATEGGARIRGTRIMTLRETLERYSGDCALDYSSLIETAHLKNRRGQTDRIRKGLSWLRNEADAVHSLCKAALPALNCMLECLQNPQKDRAQRMRMIGEVNKIADRMASHQQFKEVVKDRLCRVLVKQFQSNFALKRTDDEDERLRIDLSCSHLFFDQMDHVAEEICDAVCALESERDSTHTKSADENRVLKIAFVWGGIPFQGHALEKKPMGGTETAIIRMAQSLAAGGHTVTIYGNGCSCTWDGVRYADITQYREDLNQCPADVLVASRTFHPFLNDVDARVRIFWTGDAHDQSFIQPLAQRHLTESIDRIFTVSRWQRDMFSEEFGIPNERFYVTRNGIHWEDFKFPADLRDRKKLIYTSTPFRGLDVLLDVFPEIRKRVPGASLDIYSSMAVYGIDRKQDESLYGNLYEKAKQDGITLKGSVPQSELAAALLGAGIFAYPNHFPETSCIAAMEAMAAGLPIVTSRLGALPETVAGGGILIEGDPRSPDYQARFVEQVCSLMNDTDCWEQLSRNGRCRMEQNNRWCIIAREWVGEFHRLLQPASAAPHGSHRGATCSVQ
jgi:glycosyltransferase involved in cell wall biosynthesis